MFIEDIRYKGDLVDSISFNCWDSTLASYVVQDGVETIIDGVLSVGKESIRDYEKFTEYLISNKDHIYNMMCWRTFDVVHIVILNTRKIDMLMRDILSITPVDFKETVNNWFIMVGDMCDIGLHIGSGSSYKSTIRWIDWMIEHISAYDNGFIIERKPNEYYRLRIKDMNKFNILSGKYKLIRG